MMLCCVKIIWQEEILDVQSFSHTRREGVKSMPYIKLILKSHRSFG